MNKHIKIALLLAATFMLISCAGPAKISPEVTERADELYQQKAYLDAAAAFLQQAEDAQGEQRTTLLLRAVIAYARAPEQLAKAHHLLQTIQVDSNNLALMTLLRLTQAHIALAERNAEQVLKYLAQPFPANTPALYMAEYYELRSTANSMLGNRTETARERIFEQRYLRDDAAKLESQRQLWQALSMLSERSLQQLQPAPPPDILSGWMELVRLAKHYQLNPTMLRAAIANWQRNYPDHPVLPALLEELRSRKQEDVVLPKEIAVLLPLSGQFKHAATAIQDGLIAAYFSQKEKADIKIRVYDTGDQDEAAQTVYQTAVKNGAKFIIGPLDKSAIEKLIQTEELPVPTLALNYIPQEENLPANLFQFGLSPEEEARQVAERTWLDGHVKAAVLTPAGPWGDRVFAAFRERWESLGGKVVEQQSYNPNLNDYSTSIRDLLNVDDSQRRYRAMTLLLNEKLKYTPRRRQDIDFIFLAAFPRQARQIRPQLKFFHATDVPVYATSNIFTGNLNPDRDRDMDGIRFGDMPWVLTETTSHHGLRSEIEAQISKEGNKQQRLYALGVDAFNIIAALSTLKSYPYERYQGETGSLSLDAKQRIHRQLTWVYFRSGRPITLEQESQ